MTAQDIYQRLTACGIPLSEHQAAQLQGYLALLADWNTRMDLTAVCDEAEMVDRHLADSLYALTVPGLLPETGRLIDVGTGAGLPGLPLAVCLPGVQVTLLDAQQKRLNFLQAVVEQLGLKNVTLVHARAEDGARQSSLRASFDLSVARAVAPLPVLLEYLLPYTRVGGKALCWKGPGLTDELAQGRKAAFLLGGSVGEPVAFTLPGRDWQHVLLPVDKQRPTPKTYPRKAGDPGRKPLGT